MFERWQYRRGLAAFLAAGLVGLAALAGADAAPRKQQKPCAESLDQCPDSGCAFNDEGKTPAQQQAEALLNRTKRHKVTGGPWVRLTFDDFEALQEVAASRVDNGRNSALSETDRAKLRDLPLPSGKAMAEGDRVELLGFVVQDSPRPKPAGAESVNCRLTRAANNDIHIPIVEDPEDDEFRSVVVEMIPQGRDPKWKSEGLKRAAREGRPVLVRGQLFYDNKHEVNDDSDHDNGEPKRRSLWEIHPVSELYVCYRQKRDCERPPEHAQQDWKRLEEF